MFKDKCIAAMCKVAQEKERCFFIFSSCNWTCMQLTLQWPGSFCIVCLYILYITTVLDNFKQDSIAIHLKSCEAYN